MTRSQPRKLAPSPWASKRLTLCRIARKTSWPTSTASASGTPARRIQWYTKGAYNATIFSQARGSLACTRWTRLDEVEPELPTVVYMRRLCLQRPGQPMQDLRRLLHLVERD